jgi:hypothetical protein
MIRALRWRMRAAASLPAAALAACSSHVHNTTLDPQTEFGRDIDQLWDILSLAASPCSCSSSRRCSSSS